MEKNKKLKYALENGEIGRNEITDIIQEHDIDEEEYSKVTEELLEKNVKIIDEEEEVVFEEAEESEEEFDENGEDEYYDSEILKNYLHEINKYPLLDEVQERELLKRFKNGDLAAKEELITSNLRNVAKIALKYAKKSFQYMDLIQDGTIGLIKAIERFEPEKGYRLNTYASWWIKREIIEAIKEKINMIKVPGYVFLTYKKIEKVSKKLEEEFGRKPKTEEIAKAVEMEVGEVENILLVVKAKIQGLDQQDSEGEKFEFEIKDNTTEEEIDRMMESLNSKLKISTMFDKLDSREKSIVSMYFGLNDDGISYTFKEIGEKFGISAERVRVIKERALRKLRTVERVKWW